MEDESAIVGIHHQAHYTETEGLEVPRLWISQLEESASRKGHLLLNGVCRILNQRSVKTGMWNLFGFFGKVSTGNASCGNLWRLNCIGVVVDPVEMSCKSNKKCWTCSSLVVVKWKI